ncbi:T9SS type B sorting domain-containing protein [Nonlabens marinus]|uniref:PKD domain-containing protein n=1 Tax=Nonlabens marinus S1-08 TaxID=1454201 RepID=W8VZS0_9FLAO|nr:T9SS type B sorting domain-containing protein [Nonlabens marinus]BAO55061.1 hypothetical protein NMS_1052 [Nonlabens marinus S1-08]
MMKILIYSILALTCFHTTAQKEADNWYFGKNAGISFTNGAPTALLDGKIEVVYEGSATISDATGNLLFYSDGLTVWNRDHQVMPNGTGLNGHISSSNSAMIVKKPSSETIYYVFTLVEQGYDGGLQYSEIDMSLDGGLGDITSVKNISLRTNTTEHAAIFKVKNENAYWLIVHDWDNANFLSYKISSSGINATPIVSTTGVVLGMPDRLEAIGHMKVSPRGDQLIMTSPKINLVQLFDFNDQTGVLSNAQSISQNSFSDPYGIEFSPNGNLFYISNTLNQINQFDLRGSIEQIKNSQYNYGNDDLINGSLQLGPDGKIYLAQYGAEYLSVINKPNERGEQADFVEEGVYLGGNNAYFGLPIFNQEIFYNGFQTTNNCLGSNTEFVLGDSIDTLDSVMWDFGDGSTSTTENPIHMFQSTGTYEVSLTLFYNGKSNVEYQKIKILNAPVANNVEDLNVCSTDGFQIFDLTTLKSTVLGSQDPDIYDVKFYASEEDLENNNPINEPSNYQNANAFQTQEIYATVSTGSIDCTDSTLFRINVFESPSLPVVLPEMVVCEDGEEIRDANGAILYDLDEIDKMLLDFFTTLDFDFTYFSSEMDATNRTDPLLGIYPLSSSSVNVFVRVANRLKPDCYEIRPVSIKTYDTPLAYQVDTLEQCASEDGGSVTVDLTLQNQNILNGQSTTDYAVSYYLTQDDALSATNVLSQGILETSETKEVYARVENVLSDQCFSITSFITEIVERPILELEEQYLLCNNIGTLEIQLEDLYDSIRWSNGTTANNIQINQAGVYTVTVYKEYDSVVCETFKEFTVIESTPPQITDLTVREFSQNRNSIEVIMGNTGSFEYSIDNVNFQTSRVFQNVEAGTYEVIARDVSGCGISTQLIQILDYPQFFTPNGDGYHDFWHIKNSISDLDSLVFIYDRYGKLIKQLTPQEEGWNGTSNGVPMPSSDYWFEYKKSDNTSIRGHFSLKR